MQNRVAGAPPAEPLPEIQPRSSAAGLLRSALIGGILAVDAAGTCLALAALCFAGALSAGLGLATSIFLLATLVSTLALYWGSGLRVALGITQDTSVAIIAPAVVLAATRATGPVEAQVATGLAVIGASALLSGLVFWAMGRFGLGRVVRLFPYPVAAGFLASSGALLVVASLSLVTGATGFSSLVAALQTPAGQGNVAATVAMAACLLVGVSRWNGATALLVVVAVFLALFYGGMFYLGLDRTAAVQMGLLPGTAAGGEGLRTVFGLYGLIDWQLVLMAAPTIAAVVMLNLIGMLLNVSGVELATGDDLDINRELRVTGLSNLVIGGFGGLTGYLQGGITVLANRLDPNPAALVAGHVAVLLMACLFAGAAVAHVPLFMVAGLLMFIGATMLNDWLLVARRQLSLPDWLLVCTIVALALGIGVLFAIGTGLVLAIVSFAVGYARLPVIRKATDASRRPSVVDRAPEEAAVLGRDGQAIRILHLQGAVFFGSIDQLAAETTGRGAANRRLQALILDFAAVASVDSAACAGLSKLARSIGRTGARLHLTTVAPAFAATFARWGLPVSPGPGASGAAIRVWPTLDAAVQQCEEELLDRELGASRSHGLFDMVTGLAGGDPRLPALIERLEPLDLQQGQVLIHAGGAAGDVYILETGRLGIYLTAAPGSSPILLRIMAPGAIVGEVAYLLGLPRTADVVAETPARVWRMALAEIERMSRDDAGLAQLWASILARDLAHKVVQTNLQLSELRRV